MNVKALVAQICFFLLSAIFVLMFFVNRAEGKEAPIGMLVASFVMTTYSLYRWWYLERKTKSTEEWLKQTLSRSKTDILTANVVMGGFGLMIIYLLIFSPEKAPWWQYLIIFLLALVCLVTPVFYGLGFYKNRKAPSLYDVLMGKTNDSVLWTIEIRTLPHAKNIIPVSKFEFHLKSGGLLHLMVDPPYVEPVYALLAKHNPQMKFGNSPENKEWYTMMRGGKTN
ncbi:hypothetical protein K1X76_01055 [bacterium]|nr:hypothetical protein [bacterium]